MEIPACCRVMFSGRVARAGRSGMAYSLIAPDEMAFLIDLHVFLGRPLKTVPVDGSAQGMKINNDQGPVVQN